MSNKPLIILSVLACLTLVGCSEKGPAEQAGEKVIANIRFWADGHRPPDQVLEGLV